VETSRRPPLAGLFGTGRCGSTWVGSCLASHPEVAYRFEPLHRRQRADARADAVLSRLHTGELLPQELPELYAVLLSATPDWEKPPFHPHHHGSRLRAGRAALWPLARRNLAAAWLFQWLYTPRTRPLVLFKEVDCERAFVALSERTEVPLLYLLRHPAAVVHSLVEGQRRGRMPQGRRAVIHTYLEEHAPELMELCGPDLSDHGAEALLWRANVERCVAAASGRSHVQLVVYERVVREPNAAFAEMLRHLGLAPHPQMDAFLGETRSAAPTRRFREIGIDPYFSVFRDGSAQASRWQRELDAEQRREIARVVKDSPVFALGSRLADWDA